SIIPSSFQFSEAVSKSISLSNSRFRFRIFDNSLIFFSKFLLITIPDILNPIFFLNFEECLCKISANVLQLPEGGDFEALHCQPSRNFDRSTKLDLTTEPPLLGRCC